MALQAFHEDDSRHERWPEILITKRGDEREGIT
jgi:hypothetical protein